MQLWPGHQSGMSLGGGRNGNGGWFSLRLVRRVGCRVLSGGNGDVSRGGDHAG
uniref:Uncharacterized protein n=1 Tax=Anguilla anguilla TaxID=7936 RepID=A0A0E9QLF8_ANGAN